MTASQSLARQEVPDTWALDNVARRIKLYQQPGWGLERATGPQLNLLALYCQKLQLLPGEEVTLYDGKPWITVDGRVTLMRRHEEYITHRQRPLTREEKEAWGYDPGDIVVVTTVVFLRHGNREELEAYGRVSVNELEGKPEINPETGRPAERLNPLARRGRKPVELAMKRSLARGERFTFGTAHDDEDPEDVARAIVTERKDPERIATNAATYARIFEDNYPEDRTQPTYVQHAPQQAQQAAAESDGEVAAPEPDASVGPQDVMSGTPETPSQSAPSEALVRNRRLVVEAREAGVKGVGPFTANETWPEHKVEEANRELQKRLMVRNGDAEIARKQEGVL